MKRNSPREREKSLRNTLGLLVIPLLLGLLFVFFRHDARGVIPYVFIALMSYYIAEVSALALFIGLISGLVIYYVSAPSIWFLWEILERTLSDRTNLGILTIILFMGFLYGILRFGRECFVEFIYRKDIGSKSIEFLIWLVGMFTFLSQYFSYMVLGFFRDLIAKKRKIPREIAACYIDIMSIIPCPFLSISVWGIFILQLMPNELGNAVLIHVRDLILPIIIHSYLPMSLAVGTLSFIFVGWPILKEYSYFDDEGKSTRVIREKYAYSNVRLFFMSMFFFIVPLIGLTALPIILCIGGKRVLDAIAVTVLIIILFTSTLIVLYIIIDTTSKGFRSGANFASICSEIKRLIVDEFWKKDVIESMKSQMVLVMLLALIFTLNTLTRDYLHLKNSLQATFLTIVKHFPLITSFLGLVFPAMSFLMACLIAYAFGSAFLTLGILIPLVVDLAPYLYSNLTSAPLAAVVGGIISGATYGNVCSRVADSVLMVKDDYLSDSDTSSNIFMGLIKCISSFSLLTSLFIYFLLPFLGYNFFIGGMLSIFFGILTPFFVKHAFRRYCSKLH